MLKFLVMLTAWLGAGGLHAFTLPADTAHFPISAVVQVLEDPSGRLGIDDVRSPDYARRFEPAPVVDSGMNLGFSGSAFWLRWTVQRAPGAPSQWLLEIPFAQVNDLVLHSPGLPPVRTGSDWPLASRPVLDRFFVFPVAVDAEPRTFYLRVASANPLTVSPVLWQPHAFEQKTRNTLIVQALYYGGLLTLLVYNLFFCLTLKDRRFLLYLCYAVSMGAGMLAGNGFGRMFLWPDAAAFDVVAQVVFFSLAGTFSLLLARGFLQAETLPAWFGRAATTGASAFTGAAALLLSSMYWPMTLRGLISVLMVLSSVTGLAILAASIQSLRHGQRSARFFVLAWGILWLGVVVASLRSLGWAPTNMLTSYALQIASAIEMILLAMALGHMIQVEREMHVRAQQLLVDSQAQMLALRKSAEIRLERLVNERTAQLKTALQHEQALLSHSRRFASLVSHEFRNPLGIISSQLSLLRKEHDAGLDRTDKRLTVMGSATRRLSLIFDKWIQNDRQHQSLQALHPHAIELTPWIEHLLEVNSFHLHTHDVVTKAGDGITTVQADERQLEIAISNLLENAAKFSSPGTRITVTTRTKAGFIGIAVADEGPGIEPRHHTSVFEEFFRVSPEGPVRGMGLGLPIVRRIIEAHGGHLELQSQPGRGSDFCAWLPAPACAGNPDGSAA